MIEFRMREVYVKRKKEWLWLPNAHYRRLEGFNFTTAQYKINGTVYDEPTAEFKEAFKRESLWGRLSE